ncbi:non-ribosomal peptide synthetase [Actinokineospora sp. HUAS TT18]|uniref:non-ribosomal peptide synthetase n=1 Tax=Actinokineospora sp. HUAS TT18 TaxID=3447451 RepID=UPI003F526BA7
MSDSITLSLGQERLWFLNQFTPGDASYNIPIALRVRGRFDRTAFAAALTDVVTRHEALRTLVQAVDGKPVGVLAPAQPVEVSYVDAGDAAALVAEWSNAPFDLAAGPLLRASVARLGDDDHVVSLVVHHIASDGWSMGVLLTDLTACYDARVAGAEPDLPAPPLTYADAAAQQRVDADSDTAAARLAYWTERLAGAPTLELPTDRPRPAVKTSDGAFTDRLLDPGLVAAVKAVSRATRTTPFMVYLTAFQIVLWRYSGQRDFCVGSSISGRQQVELESVVGLFSNTIVLRADLTGAPTFQELLKRTRATALGAFSNQDIPFERLLTDLGVERDLSRSPVFDVMFTVQNFATGSGFAPAGLDVTPFDAGIRQAKYDLAVEVWATDAGPTVQLNYNTDLYDAETADRLLGHFHTVLRAAAADPETPVAALPLMDDAEWAQVGRWNTTDRPQADSGSVATAIAARALRDPDAVAVVSAGHSHTYRDLLGAAADIALRLTAAGVARSDLVALHAPRSFEALAAILGIWTVGAGYVPLDADHPAERLAFVTRDCGARVAVSAGPMTWFDGTVVSLDNLGHAEHPGVVAGARDVAYQMYTSGSTGLPKGVAVEHRSVMNLLGAMWDQVGAEPGDRWLGLTSLSFDISVLELMLPLVSGGRVVLADVDAADGRALLRLINAEGVTHVQATPSGWQPILAEDFTAPLVVALCGGEALSLPQARDLRGRVKQLHNVYGPTETTIWSTSAELPDVVDAVTIGTPLANTRCYVVADDLAPLPVGVPGELVIGGEGVARGYPGRPGLTATRFVPDPFGPPGGRLYRTGDRVRRRADGAIEYIGRWDNQVKLRGHRIELGEIEAVLAALPGVTRAAVVVREDNPGDPRLVGYVVGGDVDTLRQDLAAKLPAHMVPSALVALDRLPLTPNGKLDRAALPAPVRAPVEAAPRESDPVTDTVAAIWCEVLNLDAVSLDDDLFDLGGHSLTITQIAVRIRGRLGVDVPLHVFYDESTVAAIADTVKRMSA